MNEPADSRRPWTRPLLIRHESLTVLTQSFLGGDVGVQFALLQIPCSIVPNNPNCLPGGPGPHGAGPAPLGPALPGLSGSGPPGGHRPFF